ncbi:MAG: hypothetical protein GQ527_08965 [Bacteroidales bacterium]|nr:hypothetical protein [Bacteroidales bacterium]
MDKILFLHHHIFKNAGTSLDRALKDIFGNAMYFYDTNKPGGVIDESMLTDFINTNISQEIACLSSHQSCIKIPENTDFKQINFVILRDPLRRFLSIYNYHKRIIPDKTKLDFLAKESSFKDFMIWIINKSPSISANFQTNFCSRTLSIERNITKTDLMIAKENLLQSEGTGIVERYDESITLFNRILEKYHIKEKLISYQENTSKLQTDTIGFINEELGIDLVNQIKEMNAMDYELYNYTHSLLDKKMNDFKLNIS